MFVAALLFLKLRRIGSEPWCKNARDILGGSAERSQQVLGFAWRGADRRTIATFGDLRFELVDDTSGRRAAFDVRGFPRDEDSDSEQFGLGRLVTAGGHLDPAAATMRASDAWPSRFCFVNGICSSAAVRIRKPKLQQIN